MADYNGESGVTTSAVSTTAMTPQKDWDTNGKYQEQGVQRAGALDDGGIPGIPVEEPSSKWYHAGFHVTTVIVGTGVLGLPGAMSQLTWAPGIALLTIAFVTSYYCACLLGKMHYTREKEGSERKRLITYFAIGEYVFGKKLAEWLVAPFQLVVLTGTCIAYMIASSTNIDDMYNSNCEGCTDIKLLVWSSGIAVIQIVLCFFPSLESITAISILASVCSVGYCIISVTLCFYVGKQDGVEYGMLPDDAVDNAFNIFTGLATMAFAFGVHMMIPEIQATLAPYPPPEKEFIKGVSVAWVLVFILYYCSAISGYWAFGRDVKSNILSSIVAVENISGTVKAFVTIAEVLVVVHVVIAYQVLAMPVYGTVERAAARKWPQLTQKSPYYLRVPVRFCYVGITYFIAILIPFFGDIMALFGALGMTPLTFILPAVFYILYMKQDLSQMGKIICYIISVVGTLVGIAGTIASIRQIALDADTFEVFS